MTELDIMYDHIICIFIYIQYIHIYLYIIKRYNYIFTKERKKIIYYFCTRKDKSKTSKK